MSGARLLRAEDGARLFSDVAPLETAGPADVSFLENRRYIEAFVRSRAGAAFVDEKAAEQAPPGMALLVSKEPYKAYALAAQAFYPAANVVARRAPSAVIDPTAVVPEDCDIGPNVVIERGVRLGHRCRVGANTVIAAGVEIGDDCRIARQCDAQPLPDRIARRAAPGGADRPGRVRICARPESARSKSRSSGGS